MTMIAINKYSRPAMMIFITAARLGVVQQLILTV